MRAVVCIRSQHARGSWPSSGPDKYVAVQVVPDGVEPLKSLDRRIAARRGIEIHRFGEGYWNRTGPTSSLGKAKTAAEAFAAEINAH